MTRLGNHGGKLPARFEDLVREMPPRAIMDEVDHANAAAMIDRLMAAGRLSKGQELYLETLVQLVEVYEAAHAGVEGVSGVELLAALAAEHGMTATDVARVLGVHASMGSKILKGERALTVAHAKALGERFGVGFAGFLE